MKNDSDPVILSSAFPSSEIRTEVLCRAWRRAQTIILPSLLRRNPQLNRADVEDAVSEGFMRALRKYKTPEDIPPSNTERISKSFCKYMGIKILDRLIKTSKAAGSMKNTNLEDVKNSEFLSAPQENTAADPLLKRKMAQCLKTMHLTDDQETALDAYLSGASTESIAKAAGVNKSSAYRRVVSALTEFRSAAVKSGVTTQDKLPTLKLELPAASASASIRKKR